MSKGKDIKPHIGIFGRRNNGKSSFINALTCQEIAIVSETPGTTTDPVRKSFEIFGIGPAILIDTAGFDDEGELGAKRISKTLDVIKTIDCAVLLITQNQWETPEQALIEQFNTFDIPFLVVHNKEDLEKLLPATSAKIGNETGAEVLAFSNLRSKNTDIIIAAIKRIIPETAYTSLSLFDGLVKPKDIVVLVTPIDSEAPEGRMILPQVMAIRDLLNNKCICVVLTETDLGDFITNSAVKPALVVTDSQAFQYVSNVVPENIPLTSFSILFARIKNDFEKYVEGTSKIGQLKDGDRILILESCSHRVSCEDIGRFKIPELINKHSGKEITFEVVSGLDHTSLSISSYALVIQCGGCVFTRKQLMNRLKPAIEAGVPVTNYGMTIAWINNIFERVIKPIKPNSNEKLSFLPFK